MGAIPPQERQRLALALAQIALDAGAAIMTIYAQPFEVRTKDDKSPVSEADEAAEAIIIAAVQTLLPDWCIMAEEACARDGVPDAHSHMIVIDPLDGTKEFIAKRDEFTVNIALVVDGVPEVGCVYAPALKALYLGGDGAWMAHAAPGATLDPATLTRIACRAYPADGMTAVMSRSHADAETESFAAALPVVEKVSAGSSLKFCLVAEGKADVYPRFGPTMEWDTAAGHAVVAAAGGRVVNPDGTPFRYGKTETKYLNGPFAVWGGDILAKAA
ncbi:MAG: 3'(2'),5'-bisphosphate nucleotidase CysQ [Sphingomonadales bacterium]|nr:MAG: 3'(2'),5'-bisphosphate nucleotidase CysQ [Sphingomonadales bacterium]